MLNTTPERKGTSDAQHDSGKEKAQVMINTTPETERLKGVGWSGGCLSTGNRIRLNSGVTESIGFK